MELSPYLSLGNLFVLALVLNLCSCCGRSSELRPELALVGPLPDGDTLVFLKNAKEFKNHRFYDNLSLSLYRPDTESNERVAVDPDSVPSAGEFFANMESIESWDFVAHVGFDDVPIGQNLDSYSYSSSESAQEGLRLIEEYLQRSRERSVYVGTVSNRDSNDLNEVRENGQSMIAYVQSHAIYLRFFWCRSFRFKVSDAGIITPDAFATICE